jgi:hypothetical protein
MPTLNLRQVKKHAPHGRLADSNRSDIGPDAQRPRSHGDRPGTGAVGPGLGLLAGSPLNDGHGRGRGPNPAPVIDPDPDRGRVTVPGRVCPVDCHRESPGDVRPGDRAGRPGLPTGPGLICPPVDNRGTVAQSGDDGQ